jgi:branched-chain amino acid transport system permease protein
MGGGLGADLLAISPAYGEEYLVYFMIVVSVGGLGTIRGPFLAAAMLGVLDTAAKYLVPQSGAVFIFVATFVILFWRPQGLLGRVGLVR